MACATRPETPVSTSSKIILVTPWDLEKMVLRANIKRDSSPPEAILAKGRISSPGLVECKTQRRPCRLRKIADHWWH